MLLKQSVPEYLTNRKNIFVQVAFTALFAYIFINIYRPFGYDSWYKVEKWELIFASAGVVLAGMIVIILSRIILLRLKKDHEITFAMYIWFIVAEIIFMGGFFTSFEIFVLNDTRNPMFLMFNAIQNTSLILLIPYTVTILYFAWSDIQKKFESMVQQFRSPSDLFIPIKDDKGRLKATIKSSDLLFLESNDNYIVIYYLDNEKEKKMMIRNSLKNIEKTLRDYPVERIHRKYSVNLKSVKMMIKSTKGYDLIIKSPKSHSIPVSTSYQKRITELLNIK